MDEKNEVSVEDVRAHVGDILIKDLLAERKSNRRWTFVKRFFLSGTGLALFGLYVMFQAEQAGFKLVPSKDMTAVVNITGAIAADSSASASSVITALESACERPNVKGVILALDTPGGQPNEAEAINNFIDVCKSKYKKRVVSVVKNMAASAGYMVAIHTDKIYAGEYSVVGSIGVIMKGWDVHKLMDRFDVAQRVYSSGEHKDALDPFMPMSEESEKRIRTVVNDMADVFIGEVKTKRAGKLKSNVNIFDGFVWPGKQAKEIGLIDDFGTVEGVAEAEFKAKPFDFGPVKRNNFGLFSKFGAEIVSGMFDEFEARMSANSIKAN